jgi:hypothetical protein
MGRPAVRMSSLIGQVLLKINQLIQLIEGMLSKIETSSKSIHMPNRIKYLPGVNKDINKLEGGNMDMNRKELLLKRRIQLLEKRGLALLRIDKDTDISKYFESIVGEKENNLIEQDSQINERLESMKDRIDKIMNKLYGQHPQVLQDAAKELNIQLPRPKTRIWKNFKDWVYEDPNEIQNIFFKKDKAIINEYVFMLEDMLVYDGKCIKISEEKRKDENYQKNTKNLQN